MCFVGARPGRRRPLPRSQSKRVISFQASYMRQKLVSLGKASDTRAGRVGWMRYASEASMSLSWFHRYRPHPSETKQVIFPLQLFPGWGESSESLLRQGINKTDHRIFRELAVAIRTGGLRTRSKGLEQANVIHPAVVAFDASVRPGSSSIGRRDRHWCRLRGRM